MDNVILSVLVIGFTDGMKLERVLNRILEQEVNFSFEIIIETEKLSQYGGEVANKLCNTYPKLVKTVDNISLHVDEIKSGKYIFKVFAENDGKELRTNQVLKEFVDSFEDDSEIMVSISMTAYNQEKYIARALESILMQEVNFKYEVIIGEDCSTDATRRIIEKYRRRFPDIIKPIYHSKNVGLRANNDMVRRRLRGKYRAILEGDDYWLVKDKMQKQVDFLEKNQDFVGITGDYIDVDKRGELLPRPNSQIYSQEEIFDKEELQKWKMPSNTLALTHRNIFRNCGEETMKIFENANIIGDRKLFLFLLMYGDIYHAKDYVAARMVLPASPTSWAYAQRRSNMCPITHTWLTNAENFAMEYYSTKIDLTEKKIENWIIACKCFVKNPSKRNFKAVRDVYKAIDDKKTYRRRFYGAGWNFLKNYYAGKNFFYVIFSLAKKGIKFSGRMVKHIFKKSENNDKLKKFI